MNPQHSARPFSRFVEPLLQGPLRARISAAYRVPEEVCVPPLLEAARLPAHEERAVFDLSKRLISRIRAKGSGSVVALMQEYSLSSEEGLALMCLAEALLRIPDAETRDALIRDKIATGAWAAHLGRERPLFVNAATWGLVLTGRLLQTPADSTLGAALAGVVQRVGEPAVRAAVDFAIRRLGTQFVRGETIGEALKNSAALERRGFRYSYDMLGEAALTAEDAARYLADYTAAIHAIGRAAQGSGPIARNGISIKLSALHPRYSRAQSGRVMAELLPRVLDLARLARGYDIGLNIDAEEADRLELSLDILEGLCTAPDLAGWDGIGFVVQAYGKRCPAVIDWLIDLGSRTGHRLMVRLVKGAYWDTEIKRAQFDGLSDFPVYTRKVHTDIAYIACARRLLSAPAEIFPQFATHNARTLATIVALAGDDFQPGQYEFQCLHGMGEPLYEEIVGADKLNRPCRIYAPVGTHETLLAYLVRRLLENGANSSFVNRIADEDVPVEELAADPVAVAEAMGAPGAPNPHIRLPRDLFGGGRENSLGLDLSAEGTLEELAGALGQASSDGNAQAVPLIAGRAESGAMQAVLNPSDHGDRVGTVTMPDAAAVERALAAAATGGPDWAVRPATERAACLERAADLFQQDAAGLINLMVREAGKSVPNAIAEVREAVDFLRFYAAEARHLGAARPLGKVVCISPWNFPLAIFTGQVAAALAAGNAVIAKPAEETPLTAAAAVRLLLQAGINAGALHLLPGDGETGAALVADIRVDGVMFTGSTDVARLIARTLAGRAGADGPVPFIAETGGQNAMIVDSSALTEQVVTDVLTSAFDSAGQRCSALRVLCLQEDVAERTLAMLKGALRELAVGNPDRLAVDVGPVISAEAQVGIERHVADMRARGCGVFRAALPEEAAAGTFVAPTIIEITDIAQVEREVFGPVLHVLRYRRGALPQVIQAINATGYGLTFGLHTRVDDVVEAVCGQVEAGNVYINRNMVGAVVGVQPFGGHGLSGTGPKAGGPLYLHRLTRPPRDAVLLEGGSAPEAALAYLAWLRASHHGVEFEAVERLVAATPVGIVRSLAGPVGEQNLYSVRPRGAVLLRAATPLGLRIQIGAVLASGNTAHVLKAAGPLAEALRQMPETLGRHVQVLEDLRLAPTLTAALVEITAGEDAAGILGAIAALPGPLVTVQAAESAGLAEGSQGYRTEWLVNEVSTSINTAAAGGNAQLMAVA
jgi:RHH-type proline utilization regulon transcriptional repressor/proline dehydrogenase/delta 1-pyrroline-5-carboxylate dehydrogenase